MFIEKAKSAAGVAKMFAGARFLFCSGTTLQKSMVNDSQTKVKNFVASR
jgi:hypothetical protein